MEPMQCVAGSSARCRRLLGTRRKECEDSDDVIPELAVSSVSPSKGTLSRSMWMLGLSSLQTQPMGVRLNEGREPMLACMLGMGSGSSQPPLSSWNSKVNFLGTLS
ncbi:hypothetical protein EYF80_021348 [Liparis tanakae]|uniref:Uncharacterized protein n=1 Tax=Liparis tanakae TaxID=230148 RepID=A0A4Z2HRU7_9TELE|nr:hypothetical protein EYF80_021348 [Liparis tanakae]